VRLVHIILLSRQNTHVPAQFPDDGGLPLARRTSGASEARWFMIRGRSVWLYRAQLASKRTCEGKLQDERTHRLVTGRVWGVDAQGVDVFHGMIDVGMVKILNVVVTLG